jgi:predicted tellurium resistance membrane protein TerC
MALLYDPRAWLSLVTLAGLEIVLGIDNILFLVVLVDRLPESRRGSARLLGLGFAMLTRIGLLFSITWITRMNDPLFTVLSRPVTGRALILFAGGAFLVANSMVEIRETLDGAQEKKQTPARGGFWLIILQIGVLDIAFSLDSVFTAVGLANRIEIMVAAIVASVLVMMVVSAAVGAFIARHPTIKVLALAFLILVGAGLIGDSMDVEIPKGYLYFAMIFSAVVEWLNMRIRRGRSPGS